MNLQKLFELQRQLDEHIEKEHPRQEGEDRLSKKILAFMVELGELCQEWRGFKYWSHDQKPRTEVKILCRFCDGEGEGYFCGNEYTGQKEQCIHCHGTGIEKTQNRLLEEFADCLHFLLSIGNDINMNEVYEDYEPKPLYFGDGDILGQFIAIYDLINSLYFHRDEDVNGEIYDLVFAHFLGLGEMLGFTWAEIEEAYLQKNKINHKRMESGY